MNTLNAFTNYTDENGNHKPLKDLGGATGNVVTSVNGMSGDVTVATQLDYSEEEQDTGVKWIDGKTIYRRVVRGKKSGNTELLSNFDTVINAYGMLKESNDDNFGYIIGSYASNNSYSEFQFYKSNDVSHLTLASDSNHNGNYVVVVEYTK